MEMEEKKYNEMQKIQIESGKEMGLSEEQLELYADPDFTWDQMEQILLGFCNGLSVEEVKTYAQKKYGRHKMAELRMELLHKKNN